MYEGYLKNFGVDGGLIKPVQSDIKESIKLGADQI